MTFEKYLSVHKQQLKNDCHATSCLVLVTKTTDLTFVLSLPSGLQE